MPSEDVDLGIVVRVGGFEARRRRASEEQVGEDRHRVGDIDRPVRVRIAAMELAAQVERADDGGIAARDSDDRRDVLVRETELQLGGHGLENGREAIEAPELRGTDLGDRDSAVAVLVEVCKRLGNVRGIAQVRLHRVRGRAGLIRGKNLADGSDARLLDVREHRLARFIGSRRGREDGLSNHARLDRALDPHVLGAGEPIGPDARRRGRRRADHLERVLVSSFNQDEDSRGSPSSPGRTASSRGRRDTWPFRMTRALPPRATVPLRAPFAPPAEQSDGDRDHGDDHQKLDVVNAQRGLATGRSLESAIVVLFLSVSP
jgi:hypothetical protein